MSIYTKEGKELIPIAEYAKLHGKALCTMKQKAQRGCLDTAVRVGRAWFVERDAEYVDKRYTTGEFVNWNRYRKALRADADEASDQRQDEQHEEHEQEEEDAQEPSDEGIKER